MQPNNRTLRDVLDKVLDKIGPTFKQSVYEELEKAGVYPDSTHSSLLDVERALEKIFGPDGTSLLMNALRKHIKPE